MSFWVLIGKISYDFFYCDVISDKTIFHSTPLSPPKKNKWNKNRNKHGECPDVTGANIPPLYIPMIRCVKNHFFSLRVVHSVVLNDKLVTTIAKLHISFQVAIISYSCFIIKFSPGGRGELTHSIIIKT